MFYTVGRGPRGMPKDECAKQRVGTGTRLYNKRRNDFAKNFTHPKHLKPT